METVWFTLVALMLIGYVVLDGFDLGAGALHLIVARSEQERRMVIESVGPVWDGNEVWLIAAGGTLFYAFPLLYAVSFSGFYLALNVVMWLLIFRAIGIELRSRLDNALWRSFFDGAFCFASALLIVFFGAAFGNVARGVPSGSDGYFFEPLWTDFRPGPNPGILDWYTVLCAVTALVAVSAHGALYVVLKTSGELNVRARRLATRLWPALALLMAGSLAATIAVRPSILDHYQRDRAGWIIPAVVAGGLAGMLAFTRRGQERNAFASSCVFIAATLAGAAYALYPELLPSSGDPANAITIRNAAAGARSLSAGLWWWGFGMLIAVGYFVFVYRMHRGKVGLETEM